MKTIKITLTEQELSDLEQDSKRRHLVEMERLLLKIKERGDLKIEDE